MQNHNTDTEQYDSSDGQSKGKRGCGIRRRNESATQTDVCHDYDTLPELEVGDLLFEAIEFRHGGSGLSIS